MTSYDPFSNMHLMIGKKTETTIPIEIINLVSNHRQNVIAALLQEFDTLFDRVNELESHFTRDSNNGISTSFPICVKEDV